MAVNSPLKRRAVLGFGFPTGTRVPSGTSTAFERGASLGLYYIEPSTATDALTKRLTLTGTSKHRYMFVGTG
jgi:hypothetical protein